MVKDTVCGMRVDEAKAPVKTDYNGKAFYFLRDFVQGQVRQGTAEIYGREIVVGLL